MGGLSAGVDNLAIGWEDDGSEQGLLRVKSVVHGLVALPFRNGEFSISGSSNPILRQEQIRQNNDGSCSGVVVAVAAGSDGAENYGKMTFSFSGRVLALRWAKGISSSGAPRDFTCIIDGIHYKVSNQIYEPVDGFTAFTKANGAQVEVIADNLHSGTHVCELVFPGSTDQTNRWTLFGYAVEAGRGIQAAPRLLALCAPQALTTSMQVPLFYPPSSSSSYPETYPRGVRKLVYSNSTAGAITVTIETFYNNATSTTLAVVTVPANGSAEYDFGGPTAFDATAASGSLTLRHKASAGSAITAFLVGAY